MDKLTAYITQQLLAGARPEEITSTLIAKGWEPGIVQRTMLSIQKPVQEKPKKHTSASKIIAGIFSVILVSASLGMWYIYAKTAQDDATINDDDLTLEYGAVPENENSYSDILNVQHSLYFTDKVTEFVSNPQSWNDKEVSEYLTNNGLVYKQVNSILKKSTFQNPAFADRDTAVVNYFINITDEINAVLMMELSSLINLKSYTLHRQNKDEEAFTGILQTVELGQRISAFQPKLWEYFQGINLKTYGLTAEILLMNVANFRSDFLIQQIANLDSLKNTDSGLVNAIKNEYQYFTLRLSSILSGASSTDESIMATYPDKTTIIKKDLLNSRQFLKNRTGNEVAAFYRKSVSEAQNSCTELPEDSPIPSSRGAINIFAVNSVGEDLVKITKNSLQMRQLMVKHCNDVLFVSATQIMLAIKAFLTDTNRYPDTLSDLVPKYLKSVPQDPYSTDPINYVKETRALYSVGPGGKNTGAEPEGEWETMSNPTFYMHFQIR